MMKGSIVGELFGSASLLEEEESPVLATRRAAQYILLGCKSVLNKCQNPLMPFVWTINPYRGCEFGCVYCYARYTHEFLGFEDWRDFEKTIFVKADAPSVLRKTLCPSQLYRQRVALGTATDPYQPAERPFKITRGILEELSRYPELELSITTKSALIRRDIDLLKPLAERGAVTVNISFSTIDPEKARLLEPRAPTPRLRLEAMAALSEAGIPVGLFHMPVIPGISDLPEEMEELVASCRKAGASYAVVGVLKLWASAKKRFFPFLEEHFPHIVPKYRAIYGASPYHHRSYQEKIKEFFRALLERYGFEEEEEVEGPDMSEALDPQLGLF